jgi:hypothetical protein
MTDPLPSRRGLNSPAVVVPALLSGCLPLIVIFIAALALPAAIVAAASWLLGLSDVQQVAAAVIVVGAEMVLFFYRLPFRPLTVAIPRLHSPLGT